MASAHAARALVSASMDGTGRLWRAMTSRDRRFEGVFVVGVKTTGIYCRPGCPARMPKRVNVTFFGCAAAAEQAGFRACMRCRPDRSTSIWRISARR